MPRTSSGSSGSRVYVEAHRHSFVSQSGVIAVLQSVKEHGIPDTISRRALKRARKDALATDLLPFGELFHTIDVDMTDGSLQQFPVLNPLAWLHLLLTTIEEFRQYFFALIDSTGCDYTHPWDIVLYCDEISPGNVLKPTNNRKLVGWYWTFWQFGKRIHTEALWFHLCAIRTSHMKKVKGGYSGLFSKLLRLFFTHPQDLRLGIPLEVPGHGTKMFCAKFKTMIADEAAIKLSWSWKGSSGTMMCFRCSNVVAHSSRLDLHDASGRLVPSCVTELAKCNPHTNQSIAQNARRLQLQKAILPKGRFEKLEQAMGLTYDEGAVLWDPFFSEVCSGPIGTCHFDWMHVYFVGGLFQSEVGFLLGAIKSQITDKMIHAFLKTVQFPYMVRSRSMTGKNAFQKFEGELKCSASEGLSLYPLIRAYLHCTLTDPAIPAFTSYLALCRVLDLLNESRTGSDVCPNALLDAVQLHLRHRLTSHGPQAFPPKAHYTLHLAQQLAEGGRLISCWVHERKHRELKKFANLAHSASAKLSWERGLLEDVALLQYQALEECAADLMNDDAITLMNEQEASAQLVSFVRNHLNLRPLDQASFFASEVVTVGHLSFGRRDAALVTLGDQSLVGEIWFHVRVALPDDSLYLTVISTWRPTDVKNQYIIANLPSVVPTWSLSKPLPFFHRDGKVIVVL
eukprot:Skav216075  [mRNA]  locus=scaffold1111:21114:23159:+ [translate_table: standard]